MKKPRAYTAEEIRNMLFESVESGIEQFEKCKDRTTREKLQGLAFSIFATLDGTSIGIPAFDLCCSPHPDSKDYNKKRGQNWVGLDMCINSDVHLHAEFAKRKK